MKTKIVLFSALSFLGLSFSSQAFAKTEMKVGDLYKGWGYYYDLSNNIEIPVQDSNCAAEVMAADENQITLKVTVGSVEYYKNLSLVKKMMGLPLYDYEAIVNIADSQNNPRAGSMQITNASDTEMYLWLGAGRDFAQAPTQSPVTSQCNLTKVSR